MIALGTNTRSPKKAGSRPALEIRCHFVDGSKEIFIQANPETAIVILRRINPSQLFNQSQIVVVDDYSKPVFVGSQISRVDLVFDDSGFSAIPSDYADLVELTEAEFNWSRFST